jgi:hypothetical protein
MEGVFNRSSNMTPFISLNAKALKYASDELCVRTVDVSFMMNRDILDDGLREFTFTILHQAFEEKCMQIRNKIQHIGELMRITTLKKRGTNGRFIK